LEDERLTALSGESVDVNRTVDLCLQGLLRIQSDLESHASNAGILLAVLALVMNLLLVVVMRDGYPFGGIVRIFTISALSIWGTALVLLMVFLTRIWHTFRIVRRIFDDFLFMATLPSGQSAALAMAYLAIVRTHEIRVAKIQGFNLHAAAFLFNLLGFIPGTLALIFSI
jgi:hypothetical protein